MIQSLLIHDSIIMIQCGAAPPRPAYQKRGTRRDPNPRRPRNTGKAAGSNWRVARRRPLSKSGEESARRLRAPPNCKAATRAESEKSEKARRVPVSTTAQPTIIGCAGGPAALPETDRRSPARKARKILQNAYTRTPTQNGDRRGRGPTPDALRGVRTGPDNRRPHPPPSRKPAAGAASPIIRTSNSTSACTVSEPKKRTNPPMRGGFGNPNRTDQMLISAYEKNTRRKRCWKRRPKG
jgi:hypothetical protein